jgi:hypothetical protein
MRKLRSAQLATSLFILAFFCFTGQGLGQVNFCCCEDLIFFCTGNPVYPNQDCDYYCNFIGATNAGTAAGYIENCPGSPCEAPLPIELGYFEAELTNGNDVQLRWGTVTELNNAGFEIQRASGISMYWEVLGFVPGMGTTLDPHDYSFLDETVPPGINYYRLRQIDLDGAVYYSNIEVVNLNRADLVAVWPTLAKDFLSVRFEDGLPDAAYLLEVYDMMGRKVMEQREPSGLIDISTLSQGHYVMQFSIGNNSHSARFVKYK